MNELLPCMMLALFLASPATLADDLQSLARLCATQPQSSALDQRWSDWVAEHYKPGMDMDAVIEELLNRADHIRGSSHSASGQLNWSGAQKQQIRQTLQSTALATIKRQAAAEAAG